ncbi:MAG TPA: hypothetical protein VFK86_19350 [Bauldia sp.]|nr:hypothetical protein [Bauldia sp.]
MAVAVEAAAATAARAVGTAATVTGEGTEATTAAGTTMATMEASETMAEMGEAVATAAAGEAVAAVQVPVRGRAKVAAALAHGTTAARARQEVLCREGWHCRSTA